jgi:hypothetical protein
MTQMRGGKNTVKPERATGKAIRDSATLRRCTLAASRIDQASLGMR